MERRKRSTTAGELEWTPAPEPPSPASPGGSELSWEGDGGEDDNFQSQMDERGIIGLEETHREEPMLGLGHELGPDEDDIGTSPYFEKVRVLGHFIHFILGLSLCITICTRNITRVSLTVWVMA